MTDRGQIIEAEKIREVVDARKSGTLKSPTRVEPGDPDVPLVVAKIANKLADTEATDQKLQKLRNSFRRKISGK